MNTSGMSVFEVNRYHKENGLRTVQLIRTSYEEVCHHICSSNDHLSLQRDILVEPWWFGSCCLDSFMFSFNYSLVLLDLVTLDLVLAFANYY